jgi:hypothetical protein
MNLRCITTHQPLAAAFLHAGRRIDNREMPPPDDLYGEIIGLHAGKRIDTAGEAFARSRVTMHPEKWPEASLTRGAIIAVAQLIGWVAPKGGRLRYWQGDEREALARYRRSPWYQDPLSGWIFDRVIGLPEPVPCKGFQGVWYADQPTVKAVYAQLPEEVSRV